MVEILKRNGLIAITRIILIARIVPGSSSPGPTTYLTNGSAKIMIISEATSVSSAIKLSKLEDNSQADFLLPDESRWLKTGIKLTASAPLVRIKNIKSGIVKAAV